MTNGADLIARRLDREFFGRWVRCIRNRRNMTREDFAEMCGHPASWVTNLESGKYALQAADAMFIAYEMDCTDEEWNALFKGYGDYRGKGRKI